MDDMPNWLIIIISLVGIGLWMLIVTEGRPYPNKQRPPGGHPKRRQDDD